jgi:hypothetical protein
VVVVGPLYLPGQLVHIVSRNLHQRMQCAVSRFLHQREQIAVTPRLLLRNVLQKDVVGIRSQLGRLDHIVTIPQSMPLPALLFLLHSELTAVMLPRLLIRALQTVVAGVHLTEKLAHGVTSTNRLQ